MTIVVTGATGHIGANVCRTLVKRGAAVRALHRGNTRPLDGVDVELRRADVLDRPSLTSALEGADAVIHLAARISIAGDPDGLVYRTNVEGSRNVVDACLERGVRRLVHMSSFHAFRQAPIHEPLTEARPAVGEDAYPYDRSKAAGEREVDRGVEAGLSAVILNPTGVMGPWDFTPSLMGSAVLDLCHGRVPVLAPGGSDWVDVRDVADAVVAALDAGRPGDRHLLAGGWTPLAVLAEIVARSSGRRRPRVTIPEAVLRSGLPLVRLVSRSRSRRPLYTRQSLDALTRSSRDVRSDRARSVLGFSARPLEETVASSIEWFRAAGMLRA